MDWHCRIGLATRKLKVDRKTPVDQMVDIKWPDGHIEVWSWQGWKHTVTYSMPQYRRRRFDRMPIG